MITMYNRHKDANQRILKQKFIEVNKDLNFVPNQVILARTFNQHRLIVNSLSSINILNTYCLCTLYI